MRGVKREVFAVAVSSKYVMWCVQSVCDADDEARRRDEMVTFSSTVLSHRRGVGQDEGMKER